MAYQDNWMVVACDLVTNNVLAELPINSLKFSQVLNGAGSMSGTMDLTDPRIAPLDVIGSTEPGRTAIYIDHLGSLVWGGILWTRRWERKAQRLTFGGKEMWSYFSSRLLGAGGYNFTNADPCVMAQTFINDNLAVAGSPSFTVGTQNSGGFAQVTYAYPVGLRQTTDNAVRTLSQLGVGVGFDFAVDIAYSAGPGSAPTKTINFGWPRLGRVAQGTSGTGLVVDAQDATEYVWPEDATSSGNSVAEIGSGTSGTPLSANASNPNLITAGWPVLEQTYSRVMVTSDTLLQDIANNDLFLFQYPVATPTMTIPVDGTPQLGSFVVGDDVTLYIEADERWPAGLNQPWRIVQCDVEVPDQGMATMTLTFNIPPPVVP